MNLLKKAGLAIALGATALTAAAPAEAQRYGGGYRHHGRGGDAGLAVAAGIAGLAVGAAIASDGGRYRGGYYDRGYYPYRGGYYDRGYYRYRGYYPRGGYYDDYPRCYIERRWDPYYGAPVDVRVCR